MNFGRNISNVGSMNVLAICRGGIVLVDTPDARCGKKDIECAPYPIHGIGVNISHEVSTSKGVF